MRLMSRFKRLAAEDGPQDFTLDGKDLQFETMDHGGEYDDTMPQAIKLTDRQGRSCIYVPLAKDGKVVDTRGGRGVT